MSNVVLKLAGGLLTLTSVRALAAQDRGDWWYILWGAAFLSGLQIFVNFAIVQYNKAGKP